MIFVDSSFWIALADVRENRHGETTMLLQRHSDDELITSSQVRGEAWTFLRKRMGHRTAVSFVDQLAQTPRLKIAFVEEDVEHEALNWLRRHDERSYSFVDATSFALMRRLGIYEALAFDGDFAAAGFVELRA